jgi:hypothetical protein
MLATDGVKPHLVRKEAQSTTITNGATLGKIVGSTATVMQDWRRSVRP